MTWDSDLDDWVSEEEEPGDEAMAARAQEELMRASALRVQQGGQQ